MVTIDQLNANPFLQLMNGAKIDNNSFYVLNKISKEMCPTRASFVRSVKNVLYILYNKCDQ